MNKGQSAAYPRFRIRRDPIKGGWWTVDTERRQARGPFKTRGFAIRSAATAEYMALYTQDQYTLEARS